MKLSCECEGLNSRALQILRERLHFAPHIRQMSIIELRHHQPAALNVYFDTVQRARKIVQGLVSGVQSLQTPGMVAFVNAF